jgi:Na+/phosphate symporter
MMIMDIASNIEKMGDHLFSIAKAVTYNLQWGKRI